MREIILVSLVEIAAISGVVSLVGNYHVLQQCELKMMLSHSLNKVAIKLHEFVTNRLAKFHNDPTSPGGQFVSLCYKALSYNLKNN